MIFYIFKKVVEIMDRKKFIAMLLFLILISASLLIFFYKSNDENDTYLTVKEAMVDKRGSDWFLPNGTVFHIRDKVIQTDTFRLPQPVINENDYSVDMNNICTYTVVYFDSIPDGFLIFKGNRENEFPEDKIVEFDLPVKEYVDKEYGNLSCVEPTYNLLKTMEIVETILDQNFSFVSMDVNYTGNGTFILTVKDLFLPTNTPIYWSTVYFTITQEERDNPVNPEVRLFSSSGEFLGNIGKESNASITKEIEKGDYIVISNITENASFRLYGDAFSSFDSPKSDSDSIDIFKSVVLMCITLNPKEVK